MKIRGWRISGGLVGSHCQRVNLSTSDRQTQEIAHKLVSLVGSGCPHQVQDTDGYVQNDQESKRNLSFSLNTIITNLKIIGKSQYNTFPGRTD